MRTLTPLKISRLSSGLRQIELSQIAGIPRSRLSEIECGYIKARPEEVARLASALGVDAGALQALPERRAV